LRKHNIKNKLVLLQHKGKNFLARQRTVKERPARNHLLSFASKLPTKAQQLANTLRRQA
jgi:hypothetical protein